MLSYLEKGSRPNIADALDHCARLSADTQNKNIVKLLDGQRVLEQNMRQV
jgi:hypothetical protein